MCLQSGMLAYFDCFSGVAGDMTLAALLEAGLPLERLREELAGLGLDGYRLETHPYQQAGVRGGGWRWCSSRSQASGDWAS